MTDAPCSIRRRAVVSPVMPAPTTMTSARASPDRAGNSPGSVVPTQSEGLVSWMLPTAAAYPSGRLDVPSVGPGRSVRARPIDGVVGDELDPSIALDRHGLSVRPPERPRAGGAGEVDESDGRA